MSENNFTATADLKPAVKKASKPARKSKAPVWRVLDVARRKFDAQITKNTEVKKACIVFCIDRYYDDKLRFWLDFKGQAEKLLDSRSFNKYCGVRGLIPEHVSQHVVFESNATMRRVLRDGVEAILGEKVMMFKDPLFSDEFQLYNGSGTNVQVEQDNKAN